VLTAHHLALSAPNQAAMKHFYGTVLGLAPLVRDEERIEGTYSSTAAFYDGGPIQLHLPTSDLDLPFRVGQSLNPLDRGHFAFKTDDLDSVRAELRSKGTNFADYGVWAVKSLDQIFLCDPAGNIVEIHQRVG
jgi:glyoxylase I family protein